MPLSVTQTRARIPIGYRHWGRRLAGRGEHPPVSIVLGIFVNPTPSGLRPPPPPLGAGAVHGDAPTVQYTGLVYSSKPFVCYAHRAEPPPLSNHPINQNPRFIPDKPPAATTHVWYDMHLKRPRPGIERGVPVSLGRPADPAPDLRHPIHVHPAVVRERDRLPDRAAVTATAPGSSGICAQKTITPAIPARATTTVTARGMLTTPRILLFERTVTTTHDSGCHHR